MVNSTEPTLAFSVGSGVSAVYLLLQRGEVVYAGKTVNIFCRLMEHYRNMQRERKGLKRQPYKQFVEIPIFDEVKAWRVRKDDLDKEEIALIQKYRPKCNVLMNREPTYDKLDLLEQPFFQNLLAKKNAPELKPVFKRRKLPGQVLMVERKFQGTRDRRMKVTLPRLKFLEDARA